MTAGAARHRSRALRITLALAALVMFAGFFALGTWQVFRLRWKLDLIARVEQRVHGLATPAPAAARWPGVNAADDDYRRVTLRGVYLHGAATRARASTASGIGYWLMTPLCRDDGSIVMVNRGFVAAGPGGWQPGAPPKPAGAEACARAAAAISVPTVNVTGLLRLSEPPQALRANDPSSDTWYTRDLPAMAAARGLPAVAPVAPYFVDADAASAAPSGDDGGTGPAPVGGLTVVSFPNNHLVYAVTWYALALMVAGATVWVVRDARKGRPGRP